MAPNARAGAGAGPYTDSPCECVSWFVGSPAQRRPRSGKRERNLAGDRGGSPLRGRCGEREILRGEDVAATLGDVIRAAARTLLPGGRIVLLSPHPMSTERVARSVGLEKTIDRRVDLGGFDAVLQRFERR